MSSYGGVVKVTHRQDRTLHPSIVAEFDDQLSRHHRAAFGWALACCRWDRTAAEDVLQTAYLKAHGRARPVRRARSVPNLPVRRHSPHRERRAPTTRDSRDAVARRAAQRTAAEGIPPIGLTPILRDESTRELLAALDRLSSRQREVLHLVFYQDLTIADAAEVLGVSVGSARMHYERGKAQLRRLLGENGNHAE